MNELQQIQNELKEIKAMLSTLLKQNTPFSLSAYEKGQILAKAIQKATETGDRSYVRQATKEINGEAWPIRISSRQPDQ